MPRTRVRSPRVLILLLLLCARPEPSGPPATPTGRPCAQGWGGEQGTRRSSSRSPPSARARRQPSAHINEGRGPRGGGAPGRGGLAPARAGTHRGGRGDCEVAVTHVPGFLSGAGGGGGGARAGLGRWRWPPRGVAGPKWVPQPQSRCPSLPDSPPPPPPSTTAAPPQTRRLLRRAADGARLLPLPPA